MTIDITLSTPALIAVCVLLVLAGVGLFILAGRPKGRPTRFDDFD